jgi:hypothetical protein
VSRVANPGSEKLAREASWIHAGKFAKQIELAFLYDVDWIGDGEVITDVFVLDLIFCDMVVHVDSDDLVNGGMTWDESTIKMKEYDLSDINTPINEFYWHEESYESQALNDASSHLKKILDVKYEPADLDKIARNCDYLTDDEQTQLLSLPHKYQHLFDGSLGTWNDKPYDIELKPDAKPYHSRPFPVPKIHEHQGREISR